MDCICLIRLIHHKCHCLTLGKRHTHMHTHICLVPTESGKSHANLIHLSGRKREVQCKATSKAAEKTWSWRAAEVGAIQGQSSGCQLSKTVSLNPRWTQPNRALEIIQANSFHNSVPSDADYYRVTSKRPFSQTYY